MHDSGLSFRHETYPAYKATREKLTEELQADFDRGMDRICQLLEAYRIPIITLRGYEADDVIGTLVVKGLEHDMNVVFSFATRVIVLVAGQVLIDAAPEVVRRDQRVKEAYFGEDI